MCDPYDLIHIGKKYVSSLMIKEVLSNCLKLDQVVRYEELISLSPRENMIQEIPTGSVA